MLLGELRWTDQRRLLLLVPVLPALWGQDLEQMLGIALLASPVCCTHWCPACAARGGAHTAVLALLHVAALLYVLAGVSVQKRLLLNRCRSSHPCWSVLVGVLDQGSCKLALPHCVDHGLATILHLVALVGKERVGFRHRQQGEKHPLVPLWRPVRILAGLGTQRQFVKGIHSIEAVSIFGVHVRLL